MTCLKRLFPSALVFQCRMVKEKLKSRNALSNFPTTSTASSGSTVLKIESDPARSRTPQGLKPIAFCGAFGTDKSVPLQSSVECKQRAETLQLKPQPFPPLYRQSGINPRPTSRA